MKGSNISLKRWNNTQYDYDVVDLPELTVQVAPQPERPWKRPTAQLVRWGLQ